jgi:O-antigen ligase
MAGVFTAIEGSIGAPGDAATESAGARMRFYRHGLATILRHPVLGTGTGSFNVTYNDQAAIDEHAKTSNPHNEFIMIGVQTGFVGISLMVALFAALWFSAGRLPQVESWRGRAATLAFALSCTFNSSLLDHIDGHSFAFQIALFYFAAGAREFQREDQRHRHDL